MAPVCLALKVSIGLLMVDSIIEISFVSGTVAWLHQTASQGFDITYNDSIFHLAGTPANFMVDQGHTSNGAAGTAFVLIGLGGVLAFWLRSRSKSRSISGGNIIYHLWVALNIPALLLTLGALTFVFAVTNAHKANTIDVSLASRLNGTAYPLSAWTPQGWFTDVLRIDLVGGRADIRSHLKAMRGWQYNLIPMFIIQLCQTVLTLMEFLAWRKTDQVKYEAAQRSEYS